MYAIGIDVGGTHTDLCLTGEGEIRRAKAFTTHDDYSIGILDAVQVVASDLGTTIESVLSQTTRFVTATTIVTNAITEVKGARVGVFITKGFRDTFRLLGGVRRNAYDEHVHQNPPDFARRSDIVEVEERIDRDGNVVVPMNETEVRAGVQKLLETGVDTIAVCFLWSFKNGVHEERVRAIVEEMCGDKFVTLSSEVYPVIREYERFLTAVFNSYCQPASSRLLDTVSDRLHSNGFLGQLSYFAGAGTIIGAEIARRFPILLLASGPAGGVIGATKLGAIMGVSDLITGDMGGTSFDASLVEGGKPTIRGRYVQDELETGVSLVDVVSIGAGGGSIAWIDDRGVPQVGPTSAGSMPGPICYGRGGELPTVTDAAVTLGLIDPENYLRGRFTLQADAGKEALAQLFAPLGLTAEEGSAGVLELVATNMSHALRQISIERGHDPREFLFLAFGGTLPLFVTRICEKMSIGRAVVPANSSVFSAFGLLTADYGRYYTRTVDLRLGHDQDLDQTDRWRDAMIETARREIESENVRFSDVHLNWSADLRFEGQMHEVQVPLGSSADRDEIKAMVGNFPAFYEKTYGAGTAWANASVILVNLNLACSRDEAGPKLPIADVDSVDVIRPTATRSAFVGGKWAPIGVATETELLPGKSVLGPAVIDLSDTTMFVGANWACTRDRYFNFVFTAANELTPKERPSHD